MCCNQVHEIVILKNSLQILKNRFVWPLKSDELNPPRKFYYVAAFMAVFSMIWLNGSFFHLISQLRKRNYENVDMDSASVLGLVGTYIFNFFFVINVKRISRVYQKLSDFKTYGKPPNFEEDDKKLNHHSKLHGIYMTVCLVILASVAFIEVGKCKNMKMEKQVCGIFIEPYLIFDYTALPAHKIILYCLKVLAIYLSYQTSAFISFTIMETIDHIIIRLKHVKSNFLVALSDKNTTEYQRQKLNFSIGYHGYVIDLSEEFDKCSRKCLFIHLLLTGAILGFMGYTLTKSFSVDAVILFIGWYISLVIVCSGGQRVMDESVSLSNAIYNTPWYNLDVKIQRDLILVIKRSQKPIYLRSGPTGILSYAMVLAVMKTSYSFLTLLTSTS